MALRCPRCQQNEIALETFGVYRCPACGRIDADGHVLDPPPTPVAAVTFAAPPPREWVPPGAPAAPVAPVSGSGAPPFFLAMLALDAVLVLAAAAATRSTVRGFFGLACLVPLLSGRPWARGLSLFGSTIEIAFCTFVLFLANPTGVARGVLVIDLVLQAVWIYTLFRPDTVAYFARRS